MRRKTIRTAIEIAKRFIEIAKTSERLNEVEAHTQKPYDTHTYYKEHSYPGRQSAELKRVSMDLTNILVDMRQNR